jgi:phosphatidylinositol alpha 1,6-mannosyltransferase
VPPRDGGAVAAAVAELAGDEVKRKEYGSEARAAVEGRTWTAVGDELIDHYRAVVSAGNAEGTVRTRPVSVQ